MPWIIAGGTVLSGLLGSSASKSAANAQVQAAQAQIAEQRRQYDLTRADQAPFRDTGVAANARLRYLLGLGGDGYTSDATGATGATVGAPGGTAGGTIGGAATGLAGAGGGAPSDAEVLARFTQQRDPELYAQIQQDPSMWQQMLGQASRDPGAFQGMIPNAQEWAYWRDVMGRERAASGAAAGAGATGAAGGTAGAGGAAGGPGTAGYDPSDPYGLKADKFYASGLQFGLDQGTGAINARAIGTGNYDSGATIKALTRYANDYGSTKANDVYNRLAGVSGAGQTATSAIGAAGQNMANQVSGALGAQGNARSAGIVSSGNAWGNALSGAYNTLQQNGTFGKLFSPSNAYASSDPYNYMMGSN